MTNPTPILDIKGLCKSYDSVDANQPIHILKDLDLTLNSNESIAIVGPSGSGKSTILNLIGTLDDADAGIIKFKNQDISQRTPKEKARYRNQNIGFIFQEHHLMPQCTVLENVLLPTLVPGNDLSTEESEQRARELLAKVGLSERLSHRPAQLSGGERQRVAVVRSLINSPEIILADEATGSLDQAKAHELVELLNELQKSEAISLIMVTHDQAIADKMQRCLRLENGSLKAVE